MRAATVTVTLNLATMALTTLAACHLASGLSGFEPEEGSGGAGAGPTVGGGGNGGGVGGDGAAGGLGGAGTGGERPTPCLAPGTDEPCTGDVLWSKHLSSDGNDNTFVRSFGVASDGAIYVGGFVNGITNFGTAPFGESGESGYVIKLDAGGTPQWERHIGGLDFEIVTALAVMPDDGVVVVGEFYDQVVIPGGPMLDNLETTEHDAFVTRFSADGTHQWTRHFKGTNEERIRNVAVDAMGRIAFGGEFIEELILDGSLNLMRTETNRQAFVAMLDGNGNLLWANAYGAGPSDKQVYAVRFASDGDVLVSGDFFGDIDFDLGPSTATGQDAFVAKLDADAMGAGLWSTFVKGAGNEHVWSIAECPDGSLALAGNFDQSAAVGNGPQLGTADEDLFVARIAADGAHISSAHLPGTTRDIGYDHSIACDADGRIVLAGAFDTTRPFGSANAEMEDGFVAKLDGRGGAFWVQTFFGAGEEQAKNLAFASDGGILVSGSFDVGITIGTVSYDAVGVGEDAFLVKLAP